MFSQMVQGLNQIPPSLEYQQTVHLLNGLSLPVIQ